MHSVHIWSSPATVCIYHKICQLKASFHSGKLSVDWNGQDNFSLSCELWIRTNDFNTKRNFLVRSNPRIIFLSGNRQFQLLVYACRGRWEVRYHIADYAEKFQ